MGVVEHDPRGTSGVEVPERTNAGDGASREVSRTCLLDLSVGLVEDVRRDGVHRDMGPEDSATIFRCAFRIAAFVCGTSVAMTSAALAGLRARFLHWAAKVPDRAHLKQRSWCFGVRLVARLPSFGLPHAAPHAHRSSRLQRARAFVASAEHGTRLVIESS